MAKRKPSGKKTPPWARDWPRCGDVVAWMEAQLAVAEHIDDAGERVSKSLRAIKEIAQMDQVPHALSLIEDLCDSLREDDGSNRSYLFMAAAEMCFESNQLDEMRKYLQRTLDLQRFFPRKCDRGCQERRVREFEATKGLLDPQQLKDNPQRSRGLLAWELRQARLLVNVNRGQATQHAMNAIELSSTLDELLQGFARGASVELLAECGASELIEKVLIADDSANEGGRIMSDILLNIGQRPRAIRRLELEVREALAELQSDTLNAHFPAMSIEMAITELAKIGEKDLARSLLREVLGEGESWILQNRGAFSSAVFRSLAKATLLVEGPEPARRLLDLAMADAQGDDPSGWRTSAIRENLELLVELASPEEAIDVAKTIRSHKDRRRILAPLLGRAERWDELHEVINSAADAKEAADLIWWIKFVWRPAK